MIEFLTLTDAEAATSRRQRVLIVDDHPLVRKGLALLINDDPDLEVCGEAGDEDTARKCAASLRPDVAVVDWSLGLTDASNLIRYLQESCAATRILILSMHDEVSHVERALELGASGYVMKQNATEQIVDAIRWTTQGHFSFTDRAIAALPVPLQVRLRNTTSAIDPGVDAHEAIKPPGVPKDSRADLVIAPHPDDETFGCGGTIRLVAESRTPIDVVFMTKGELGHEEGTEISFEQQTHLAQERTQEAIAACKALGVRRVTFLNGSDTRLREQPHLANDLLSILSDHEYRRVFCPWKHDGHHDHEATFALLQTALSKYPQPLQIWLYEVWTPLGFNVLIPIDRTIAHKKRAIQMYRTQLTQLNYRGGFLGLAAYRSAFCPPANYAEAFFMCSKEQMLQL